MSKKDYTKFSKKHNADHYNFERESVPEVAYPLPEDDIPEEPVAAISETVSVVEPTPEQKSLIFGKVTGCSKLNVRQRPNLQADILCCLDVNTEVEIDEDKSTNDFYAICTPSGREGFCLKKFIEICK